MTTLQLGEYKLQANLFLLLLSNIKTTSLKAAEHLAKIIKKNKTKNEKKKKRNKRKITKYSQYLFCPLFPLRCFSLLFTLTIKRRDNDKLKER